MEEKSRLPSVSEISEAMKNQTIQSLPPLHHCRSTERLSMKGGSKDPRFDNAQELYDLFAKDVSNSAPKQFSGIGSYRHLHEDPEYQKAKPSPITMGFSSESPPLLGGDYINALPKFPHKHSKSFSSTRGEELTQPIDINQTSNRSNISASKQRLWKQKSWSSETDREEAWERRKCRQPVEALIDSTEFHTGNKIARSISDCCERADSSEQAWERTRSLTDEDLEELRGCIDLGFGFSNKADPRLWVTFPALELCYAVSQQLKEDKHQPSPVSILDSDALVDASKDKGPDIQPVTGSWTISSPGDHPEVVKGRLRHWAQAVAFNIRQKL